MEEIVICTDVRGAYERWDIWKLGPRLAGMTWKNGRIKVREVWNVKDGNVREREEVLEEDGGSLRPEWGITEGWGC